MKAFLKILAIILIVIVVLLGYSKYVKKIDYIELFDYKIVLINNNNMSPRLKKGDAGVFKVKDYNSGDIIMYSSNGTTNIREITEIAEDKVYAKENYTGGIDTVEKNKIIATMSSKVAYLGTVINFITNKYTLILIGFLSAAYLFATAGRG